jgi:alpha-glucosidase
MPSDQATGAPWWKHTVVYQIYPRSFADTSGDGVGDLAGIGRHLDHLERLGVDTLWLSPIYPSPMADFGYDVADHCDIDPVFGDLAGFDRLLADVHDRGMRLLLDWVPNHTSDAHPWFVDARSSIDSAHRDYYVWRDPAPDGGPPNNWRTSLVDEPAWTLDEASGQYYLHLFLPSQPDLNWANPQVEAAMHDTLRFWLDRGVDGFRADVVHCIGKDPALVDDPAELVGLPRCVIHDDPATHPLLRRIRALLDSYPQAPMMVGEVVILDVDRMVHYLGRGDELHLSFNFAPTHLPWDAALWRDAVARAEAAHTDVDGWPTWVLSNHDIPRHRTRYASFPNPPVDAQGSDERARAAAVLLLTLRGTPFLYQGEELGLLDAEVPPERVVDPGGRDGCRAPMPWDTSAGHGWTDPWLPMPPEAETRNVEAESADPSSMLELYRALLALRAVTPSLRDGSLVLLDAPDGVLAYRRVVDGAADVTVLVSMVDESTDVGGVTGTILVDSLGRSAPGAPFGADPAEPARLAPRQAVVLGA